ncbi:MAG: T9SS C-terminal target domain-containing protein, partial [Calditrichaeota bacterium]
GAPKGFFLVHGRDGVFGEPLLVFEDTTGSYSTRWNSSVAARGNGEIAVVFSPAGLRNGQIVADLLMKRGFLFGPTGLAEENQLPGEFYLFPNHPNPFNPVTHLRFRIADFGFVELKIYDVLGREVKTLVNRRLAPGRYTVQWDGTDAAGQPVASGVYLYRLTAGNRMSLTRKMVLLR